MTSTPDVALHDGHRIPQLGFGVFQVPPQDTAALRSRRDLRRVNAWMRHPQIMARALRENLRRRKAKAGEGAPAGEADDTAR